MVLLFFGGELIVESLKMWFQAMDPGGGNCAAFISTYETAALELPKGRRSERPKPSEAGPLSMRAAVVSARDCLYNSRWHTPSVSHCAHKKMK